MKNSWKGLMIVAGMLWLSSCANVPQGAPPPQLPKAIANKVMDCDFKMGNRVGVNFDCVAKIKGLTIKEADAVMRWARWRDSQNLSQHSRPAPAFNLFGIIINSDSRFVTTSRWQQKYGGLPKYVRRHGYYDDRIVIRQRWRLGWRRR